MNIEQAPRGMKPKTIKAILAKKFNAFASSIEDEKVRKLVEQNTIITGGCIASMLLGQKVNDYDLYFTNYETARAVAEYYVVRFEVKNRHGIPCPIYVDAEGDRVRVIVKSAGVASDEGAEADYEYFEGSSDEALAGAYVGEVMSDPGDIQDAYEETEDLALDVEDAADSRAELGMLLLGRMGRDDALPVLAARTRTGDAQLRWQAVRQCLALDPATGLPLLERIAKDHADPLYQAARALLAQLQRESSSLLSEPG
ncbi:hypothetical protein [Qipengyuania flava]|uniref:hypothetical protein n=1 Tax=Qipengyuania flava TaxID=192812 RepID=UPI00273D28F2|nr:hypothetical protein [Qipengyuania flava]